MTDPLFMSAPNRQTTKIPMAMLLNISDGYYAVEASDNEPHTFIRVSHPVRGQFKGCLKIQTQHGEQLFPALTIFPSGNMIWHNMSIEEALLIVVVSPVACAIEYGKIIGRCCRCNKELTDQRSRWYSIGPECEKHWPQVLDTIADTKGPYVEK